MDINNADGSVFNELHEFQTLAKTHIWVYKCNQVIDCEKNFKGIGKRLKRPRYTVYHQMKKLH
jgi:hypothetical protein